MELSRNVCKLLAVKALKVSPICECVNRYMATPSGLQSLLLGLNLCGLCPIQKIKNFPVIHIHASIAGNSTAIMNLSPICPSYKS